jgi:dCMP deaminase
MSSLWNERFLALAREVSTWSKDPSTKIGAVAVRDRQILSVGYNGFPRGVEDTAERLNNRETKYKYVVHAEQNLIYNAVNNGISLKNSALYVWGLPVCSECAKGVIQAGFSKVYWATDSNKTIDKRWEVLYNSTVEMFNEVGIEVYAL